MTQSAPLHAASEGTRFDFREVTYSPSQTVFKLNTPRKPVVRIYADGLQGTPLRVVGMKKIGRDLWSATVRGNLKGRFYTFDIGKGETPGVFAKAVGVNGRRGAIIDWADTNPAGWENDRRPVNRSTSSSTNFIIVISPSMCLRAWRTRANFWPLPSHGPSST